MPVSDAFHLANLVSPALDGIVNALSDRGDQTEARKVAKADAARTLILSFQPRDAIELTLAGQAVLFNELFADGARGALRPMVDTMKQRSHSILVAMGRVTQGHLDRLERRGNRPFQTAVAAPKVEERQDRQASKTAAETLRLPRPAAIAPFVAAEPEPLRVVDAPMPTATNVPEQPGGLPAGEPVVETSWLDEPYEQWVVDTPADLAARAGDAATLVEASRRGNVADWEPARAAARDVAPGLPRRSEGYAPARTLVDADAGG